MNKFILNPFEKYSATLLFSLSIGSILLGSMVGYNYNARYDGVFDLHFVETTTQFQPFFDIIISIFISSLMLYIIGKYVNSKTRFIDILNSCSISKIPFYILPLFNTNNRIYNSSKEMLKNLIINPIKALETPELISMLLFSFLTITVLIISLVLTYNGYKVATNAKGFRNMVLFIFALLISEIISKIIISTFN